MLSNYLRTGQAQLNTYSSKISLNFTEGELRIDKIEQQYKRIKSLCLTYCNMTSLEGIQQFQCLKQVNIRCNCITDVGQLLRIERKDLIQRLQFVGNDIEYLGSALFINLQQHFPNLFELNGKNYMELLHKPSDRRHQMKKIIKQAHTIQKEMMKTLKKEGDTVKQFRRELSGQVLQTEHNYYVTEEEEGDHLPSRSKEGTSSRQRSMKQQSPSPARSRPSPSPHRNQQHKQNHNNSNHHEYDVSLGDISNIPMTKSVRGSFTPLTNDAKQNKRRGLQIFTLNESHNKLPLSQPTATFAMQREKENQDPTCLMFRNRQKTQKYKPSQLPIEQCVRQEYDRPTKRQTYQSVSEEMNGSWSSSFSRDNIIHEDKTCNQIKKIQLAGALFTKNLLEKVFYAWQALPAQKNFPVKKNFL